MAVLPIILTALTAAPAVAQIVSSLVSTAAQNKAMRTIADNTEIQQNPVSGKMEAYTTTPGIQKAQAAQTLSNTADKIGGAASGITQTVLPTFTNALGLGAQALGNTVGAASQAAGNLAGHLANSMSTQRQRETYGGADPLQALGGISSDIGNVGKVAAEGAGNVVGGTLTGIANVMRMLGLQGQLRRSIGGISSTIKAQNLNPSSTRLAEQLVRDSMIGAKLTNVA
jgi:hypothetical protein